MEQNRISPSNFSGKFYLATARTRHAKRWKNKEWNWADFVTKCSETKRTDETIGEFLKMNKDEQADIKDVGGFVGAYLSEGSRKSGYVLNRTLATLDIDYGTPNVWEDFTMQYNFAAVLYSTHKHTADKPRFRLIIPFSRDVKPAEYEPICRRIAQTVGIELFDITTYETNRLFYWPSTAKDGEFVFKEQKGPVCDVDAILKTYRNFQDVSEWPFSDRESEEIRKEIKKAGDPLEKDGLIGAFCRAYTIEDAIDQFLSDVYDKTAKDNHRYTYHSGSVGGGLVCYEGKFAYSHHETDPASRQLCNAFDLVRIHKFGLSDEDSKVTDINKRPSQLKMLDFVAADKTVRVLLTKERRASAETDFADVDISEADSSGKEADTEWMSNLEYDRKGEIKSTISNFVGILENDPGLKGHLWHDLFSGFDKVKNGLPWDRKATQWGNRDDANLRLYIEQNYGVSGKDKIKDAKDAIFTRHQTHPIREYLNGLQWDGTPRLDTLIIDYLGAEDTERNRAKTRKHFVAAVARIMNPGCKYDYCLIVSGAEGIGKSTLFSVMGGNWFSDSLNTMEGKQGMEQARGGWIIELPELSSIKRSEVEQVKAFISRQDDMFRPAYGTITESHPRQCVFCGTTNETYFLKGDTGNRRFWLIFANADLRKHTNVKADLMAERDQIWAEAVQRWREGEKLCLPPHLEAEERSLQAQHNDDADDPLKAVLLQYLKTKTPTDWPTWELNRRRAYLKNPDPLDATGIEERERVCAAEFICERLGHDMTDKDYKYIARKVCKLLRELDEWEEIGTSRHAEKLYGRQLSFARKFKGNSDEDNV